MKYIDTHIHVFEMLKGFGMHGEFRPIGGGKARWADGFVQPMIPEGYGDTNFLAESAIRMMDENGIEKGVLLQGSFYGFGNEYTGETAQKYPDRFIAAGTLDPFCRNAQVIFDRLQSEYDFKAFKFEVSVGGGMMGYHKDFEIDEAVGPYLPQLAKLGRTVVFDIGSADQYSYQPTTIARMAKQFPDLRFVVCHLMAPRQNEDDVLKRSLETLALPNVWFDLAAVPFNVAPEKYPYPSGIRYIRMAMDIVGADKLMWGTDMPSVVCYETYEDLKRFIWEVPGITAEELEKIYYTNATEAYSFN